MTIKTIIFDFGGVLIKTPSLNGMLRWKKFLGIGDEPEILEMLQNPHDSRLVQDICLGKVPEDYLWQIMAEKWGVKPQLISSLRRRIFSKRYSNRRMVRFLAELQQNYQTAILSNAGDQSRRLMEEIYHFDRYVEAIIISAEEGVIKPDHRIFQIAMERLHAKPDSSLFVDDYLVNVQAAREFGMQALQFINNNQTIQAINKLLKDEV